MSSSSCCPPVACLPAPPEGTVPGGAPDAVADARLAALCKALAHPHRVRILRVLRAMGSDRCYAGDIADQLPIAASTVSQHLRILRDAGLIQGEVEGPRRCYCVAPGALAELQAAVGAL